MYWHIQGNMYYRNHKSVGTKNLAINHLSDMRFWSILLTLYKKQNTNQVNNENYVTAEMETYLWRERCLSPRFRGEENKNLPKIRLPH